MELTIEQAFNRAYEKISDNNEQLRKQIRQRRNGMEDLYGVMFKASGDANTPAKFYISLSPDYIYLQRLAFKFVIDTQSADDFEVSIDGVPVTDYLIEQHNGEWMDGAGVFPTENLEDDQSDFYDIIGVGAIMSAEIETETDEEALSELVSRRTRLLRRGWKPVEISSNAAFTVDAYLYVKYDNLNR